MMKRLHLLIGFLIAAFALQAQNNNGIPAGYYNIASGKTGDELKQALHTIIKGHTKKTYSYLWTAYGTTDINPDTGKIWDIYSYCQYTLGTNECGSYTQEGNCYNREHLWARSWANKSDNDTDTMVCDLHHVYPTDGYVNAQRSNYAFGEVSNPTYTSGNGGKLGPNTVSGYNGTVFEPIDEYKGDIARALMYMSVRYYHGDGSWGTSAMTNKSVIKDWAMTMLLEWSKNDPVSQKEIDRNNAVYDIQNNRNPFIDHPEYADMIWDPNWSTTYTVIAAANPAIGGEAFIQTHSDATVSKDFSAQGYSNGQDFNGVTVNINTESNVLFSKGTGSATPKYYNDGTAIRCYGGNYFTVSTSIGLISKIVLTYGSGDGSNTITTDVGTFSTNTWTGNESSVTFTIGGTSGNRRIKAIAVTYSGGPLISVQQATVANGTTVTLTTTPNTGYHFVNWTKGSTVVSNTASFNLTVNESATYQANFELDMYTIAVAANPTAGGIAYIGNAPSPSVSHTAPITFSDRYNSNTELYNQSIQFDDSNVSVYFNKTSNNSPKTLYNASDKAVRVYWGNYFVVNTSVGLITKIVLTFGSSDGTNTITTDVGSFSSSTWTGSATSVKFTIGGSSSHRKIKTITVNYTTEGTGPVTQATFNYGETATIAATPNNGYSFVNWTKNNVNVSPNATYSFTVTENANLIANFMSNTVDSDKTVASLTINGNVTINSCKTLTVTGDITQPAGSLISILDGGQLICNNSVYVKMQKNITAWNGSKGWYAITSPVSNQSFADVVNLVNTTNNPLHNIYRYDEAEIEWEEYRDPRNEFDSFENGRGYLFRTEDSHGIIEFKGNSNVNAIDYELSYASTNDNYKGFNLIGNPFTQNITWANLTKTNVDSDGYFLLDENGTNQGKWSTITAESAPIAPMRAFLVQATGDNPSVTFSRTTAKAEDDNDADNIMFMVNNSQYSDEAYVKFKDGHGLNKIEHRNTEIPMLYVISDDEHFAIADMDYNTKVIDLGFEAKTLGQYILSFKAEGDFSCLHLIDRITGEDIDMLIEDEYSFIGAPSDMKNRFIVKFRCNSIANASDDVFAYQNGDDIIVEGTGILQVFDVTGRIVTNHNVNGVEIIGKPTRPGLYVFRLVGEDVKTQKIVVK